MKTIRAWFKTWWWVFLLIGVGCVLVLGFIFGTMFGRKKSDPASPDSSPLPPVPPKLQEKVEEAHEAALTARVEAKVKADEAVKELEEVKKIPDGKERRARLAAMLKGL